MLITAVIIWCVNLNDRTSVSPYDYIAQAQQLINLGEYDAAIDKCVEGLKKFPKEAELYLKKAQAYAGAGNNEKAVGTLDYGYKQTNSKELLDYREEKFGNSDTENAYFGVSDSGEYNIPEEDEIKSGDISETPSYNTPYPEENEISVAIPEVTPPEPVSEPEPVSVPQSTADSNSSEESSQITNESENS